MLFAVACDGIDCTGLKRNHTTAAGHSWWSLAVPTPNSVRSVRALGGLGAPQGHPTIPTREQRSWGARGAASSLGIRFLSGAAEPMASQGRAMGSWNRHCCKHHWGRDWWPWGAEMGFLDQGKVEGAPRDVTQGQAGLLVPSEPWKVVVVGGSRNILIPRHLETGSLHRATGIFYFILWPPEHQWQHVSWFN